MESQRKAILAAYLHATLRDTPRASKLPEKYAEITKWASKLGVDVEFLLPLVMGATDASTEAIVEYGGRKMRTNIFVVVVGHKGTGKTAAASAVAEALKSVGIPFGENMEKMLKDHDEVPVRFIMPTHAGPAFSNTSENPALRRKLNGMFYDGPSIAAVTYPAYICAGLKPLMEASDDLVDRWIVASRLPVCSDRKDWNGGVEDLKNFFRELVKLKKAHFTFTGEATDILQEKERENISFILENAMNPQQSSGKDPEILAKIATILHLMQIGLGLKDQNITSIDAETTQDAVTFLGAVKDDDIFYRRVASGFPPRDEVDPLLDSKLLVSVGRKVLEHPETSVSAQDFERSDLTDAIGVVFQDMETLGLGHVVHGNDGLQFVKKDPVEMPAGVMSRLTAYMRDHGDQYDAQMQKEKEAGDSAEAPAHVDDVENVEAAGDDNEEVQQEQHQEHDTDDDAE